MAIRPRNDGYSSAYAARTVLWAVTLSALAASQGGCLWWLPEYEPGFACTIEFRDKATGETIDDVLMVEYEIQSRWHSVFLIEGHGLGGYATRVPPSAVQTIISADVSRMSTESCLSRWGRCVFKKPNQFGYDRRFVGWGAYFYKDGYIPAGTTDDSIVKQSDEHDGRFIVEMCTENDRSRRNPYHEPGCIVEYLLPVIPKSNPQRRELLLLLERYVERVPPGRDGKTGQPLLRKIRKLLAEEPDD